MGRVNPADPEPQRDPYSHTVYLHIYKYIKVMASNAMEHYYLNYS